MLTMRKVDIFYEYKGQYDGYIIRSRMPGFKVELGDDDWYSISHFLEDIFLIDKGLTSEKFKTSVTERLKSDCDSEVTIKRIQDIAVELVEFNTKFYKKLKPNRHQ
jgi:hypothetical protein